MEIKIECYQDSYTVYVNNRKIGFWSYLDGAIEAARQEVLARYPEPKPKECNCEFCIKCEVCNHSADSHIAGEGNCMVTGCKCGRFTSVIADAWDKLSIAEQATTNFKEFAENYFMTRQYQG